MLKVKLEELARRFVKATTSPPPNRRWSRSSTSYLVKNARFTDGEMLHLLVGRSFDADDELDERIYQSLQTIRAQTLKAALWMAVAYAFGVLAHFHGLKSAGASGLEISPAIFSHTSLLFISISTAWFCFSYCKQGYLQAWFAAKMRNANPSSKAIYLLKYPEAYFHFSYLPNAIGYPPHVVGRRKGYGQLVALVLVLLALVFFVIITWGIWINIFIDVWNAPNVGRGATWITLSLSAVLILLGWTCPFYYDLPRKYSHLGLVNLLGNLEDEDLKRAHLKIYIAALRMGLAEPPNP